MNSKQTAHLNRLQDEVWRRLQAKYSAGAREHDGDLLDLSVTQLHEELVEELIDGLVYALTALEKLNDFKRTMGEKQDISRNI